MFKIEFKKLNNCLNYSKEIKNRLDNIKDVIPIVQNDLVSKGNNVKIELAAGLLANNPVPYAKKNQMQIQNLLESSSVIPIKVPSQPKFQNIKVKPNNKKSKTLIKKEINESIVKWLLKNNNDIE